MKILTLLLALFVTCIATAQELDATDPTPQQDQKAYKLTQVYNDELSLTGKQMRYMKDKIAKFMVKQNDILTSDRTVADKNTLLEAFYVEETKEMADILTQPQMKVYKNVKPNIQPLVQLK